MNRKDCGRCDRRNESRQVVWPTFAPNCKIIVIGEAPGRDEDMQGCGFIGQSGNELRRCIREGGIDPDSEVSYTNSVFCYGGSIKNKPTPEHLRACSRHMWRAIIRSGAQAIVPAGNPACRAILGFEGISQLHGTRKVCKPPTDVWNSILAEDFCEQNGIAMDWAGIPPDSLSDGAFLSSRIFPLLERGFQFVEADQIPQFYVFPVKHPAYYLRGNQTEFYELINAFTKIRIFLDGGGKADKDYKAITDPLEAVEYMDEVIRLFQATDIHYVAFDLETVGPAGQERDGGLQPFLPGGRVVTINLSHKEHFARVIFLYHPESDMTLDGQQMVVDKFREMLSIVPIVGANLKFDLHWCRYKLGVRKYDILFDTQLANYALYLMLRKNGLKSITDQELPHEAGYEDDLQDIFAALDKDDRHMLNVPLEKLTKYAAGDVDVVLQLIPILTNRLRGTGQWEPYMQFGIGPYPAFIEMEDNGACIDVDMVSKLTVEAQKKVLDVNETFKKSPYFSEWMTRRIVIAQQKREGFKTEKSRTKPITEAEIAINFGSSEQLAELMFDIAKMPIKGDLGKKKTKVFPAGVPSTKEEVMGLVKDDLTKAGHTKTPQYILLEMIEEYRKSQKLLSTYLQKAFDRCPVPFNVPDWWENRQTLSDPRCYEAELYNRKCQSAEYRLTSTKSGRTSSSNPNIQQVPPGIRSMYVSRFGREGLIANFDVGQAELRVLAAASLDENFIAILSDPNRDVHREIAAVALGKPVDQITYEERRDVKAIVFGTCYGRSPEAVALQLKIAVERAKAIQTALFRMMPRAAQWIEEKHAESDAHYETWTPTGRRRDLSMHTNDGERHRRAVNTPIQGGASDIIIWATGRIYNEVSHLQSKIWAYVHDSVVFDVIPAEARLLMAATRRWLVEQIPQQFSWMVVPMVVDFQFGPNWGEQCDVEFDFNANTISAEGKKDIVDETVRRFGPSFGNMQYEDGWEAKVADDKAIKISGVWAGL